MAKNYLPKEYKGTKYDGSSADFDAWEAEIVGALGPLGLKAILTKPSFYGSDDEGRIKEADIDADDLEDGLDMQSKVAMWLQTTLAGAALTKYQMLERALPREGEPRTTPKAYDVYTEIKNSINPDECLEIEVQLMHDISNRPFPGHAGREAVLEWLDQQQKTRNEIMARSKDGGGGYKDEKLFVMTMLNLISSSITSDSYQLLNRECSMHSPEGKRTHTIAGLTAGLHMLYPIGSKPKAGRGAINAFQQNACIHCGKNGHTPDRCWSNPDAVCEICQGKGHMKQICPEKNQGSKGGKGGKGDRNARRKLKKETDKAMIAFAKQHGYSPQQELDPSAQMVAPHYMSMVAPPAQAAAAAPGPAVLTIGGLQYARVAGNSMHTMGQQPPRVPPVATRGQIHLMHDSTSSKLSIMVNKPHAPKVSSAGPVVAPYHQDELAIDPDRDFAREQAEEADWESLEQVLGCINPGGTIMLCEADCPPSKDWVNIIALIDGGASVTGTAVRGTVHNHVKLAGRTGGVGGSIQPLATGTVSIMLGNDHYLHLYGTSEYANLGGQQLVISEEQLEEEGITPERAQNRLVLPDGTIVPTIKKDRLWYVSCYMYVGQGSAPPSINASGPLKTFNDVHEAMGCTGEANLRKTFDLVDGLPDVKEDEFVPCSNCHAAKDKRQPIEREPGVPEREYRLGEAVALDTSARQPMSNQGAMYWQLIVEFVSKYITAQLLASKSDATEAFREYCVKNWPPDEVQTDGGGEYESAFDDFCDALHILHRRSAPDTQAQNFMAEIAMKLVTTGARADLLLSGLPLIFWADAIQNATDSVNCRFNAGVSSGKTPYQEFHGRRPDLSMKRKFGTPCNVLVHHPDNKFAPRAIHGIYVRLAMGYKAWRIYIPAQDCYVVSRHVTFDLLPKDNLQYKEEVDKWWLKHIEAEKEDEVFDENRSNRESKTTKKSPREHELIVNPLPSVLERVDLSSMPVDKGKEGTHKDSMAYRNARYNEMKRARFLEEPGKGGQQIRADRVKIISREWQDLKRGKDPLPIPGLPKAQIPRGIYPELPPETRQAQSTTGVPKRMPDEGGVRPEVPSKEKALPSLAAVEQDAENKEVDAEHDDPPSPEPIQAAAEEHNSDEESSPVGIASRPCTRGQLAAERHDEECRNDRSESINHMRWFSEATLSKAAINAIYILEDTDGPIHSGDFTEFQWNVIMALVDEPKSLLQALNGRDSHLWRKAVQEELQSLMKLDVYEEVTKMSVPKGKKILASKVVLKYKEFERRYKARLVVLGFMQPDEDAGETFAPVAKFTTFRLLMAIACALDLDISSSDVKTAFLNAVLPEPIYIYPPRGLGYPPDTVWKLLKNLYGLKGAPRGWNLTLHAVMLELGFIQSIFDPCLYFIQGLWVLVWVDDTLKVGNPEAIAWFETELDKRFSMTHVDDVKMFVGIEVDRDRENGTLELKQTTYIDKILEHHGMQDAHDKHTPMQENTKVSREDCCKGNPELIKQYEDMGCLYPSGAAEILYLALCTRPDMAFVAKELCKVMSDPGPKHVPALKWALKYMKNTRHLGLRYSRQDVMDSMEMSVTLTGWADSSFGDDPDTKRSSQGFVAKLCGAAVSWFAQGQKSTSLSTAEAELICLADSLKEILYMRDAMKFFGVEQESPTVIFEDNQAVVATAHNPGKNHGKLKHVAIRAHRVQEEVQLETIDVVYKETSLMLADILTKALGRQQFLLLCMAILGYAKLADGF